MVSTKRKPDVIQVDDGRLIIDVELGQGRPSSSGKTEIIYTTGGGVRVDGYTVSINVYRKLVAPQPKKTSNS